jgi:hypothetical protein
MNTTKGKTPNRWGAVCAISSGLVFLVPLLFYFILLPAAGSSATHARDPVSFLPWMAARGGLRIALWWVVCLALLILPMEVPTALSKRLASYSPTAARAAIKGQLDAPPELLRLLGYALFVGRKPRKPTVGPND